MTDLIISIKPKYVEKIFNGGKSKEFKKKPIKNVKKKVKKSAMKVKEEEGILYGD